jgi:hypothetical protein
MAGSFSFQNGLVSVRLLSRTHGKLVACNRHIGSGQNNDAGAEIGDGATTNTVFTDHW